MYSDREIQEHIFEAEQWLIAAQDHASWSPEERPPEAEIASAHALIASAMATANLRKED